MKHLRPVGLVVLLLSAAILSISLVAVRASHAQMATAATPTPAPGAPVAARVPLGPPPPAMHLTDLAPSLGSRDKAVVYVFRVDGGEEGFLVAPENVEHFIQNLPAGDTIAQVAPPESIVDQHPLPPSSPRAVDVPAVGPTVTPVAISTP